MMADETATKPFRILALDGGGSKGMYTLGVLQELEAARGTPLHTQFDLIYGTSTGAIIAASVGVGKTITETLSSYRAGIPSVMTKITKGARARALARHLAEVFGDLKFDAFRTRVGIVATDFENEQPLIFKSHVGLAYGLKSTFVPGFGCTIADAVAASCSAAPFFPVKKIDSANQGTLTAIDGGFVANDPSLLALIDAQNAIEKEPKDIRIISVGVGSYPERFPLYAKITLCKYITAIGFIQRQFNIGSNTIQRLYGLLSKEIRAVRVSDTFNHPKYGTSLLESNSEKLELLKNLGRESYGKQETAISAIFQ